MPAYRPKRVSIAGDHREEARNRHDRDVAVADVRELVRDHALDLARLEPAPEPFVTATTACFGLRPVANAFGTSVGMMATRGFGRSAIAQSRSTMSCSSGACSRSTTFAPEAASAILSDVKYWRNASAADHDDQRRVQTLKSWISTTKKTT